MQRTDRHITRTQPPHRFLSTVVLTSVLSLSTGLALLEAAIAAPTNQPTAETTQRRSNTTIAQQQSQQEKPARDQRRSDRLPSPLINAVRLDLSRKVGIPPGKLRVSAAERVTWPNSCLGLPTDGLCAQAQVEGWRIVVSDGKQTWTYHTDLSGQTLRLKPQATTPASGQLPNSVAQAVLRAASSQSGVVVSQLRIASSEQRTWGNGCLDLAESGEACTEATVPGWLVVVEGQGRRLVYHTNANGSVIRFNRAASNLPAAKLPRSVERAVLQAASRELNQPISARQIVQSEPRNWPDPCLGIPDPTILCAAVVTPGWLVTVEDRDQRLTYRTNADGSLVKLDKNATGGDTGTVRPVPIASSDLPAPLPRGAVFRAIRSGGITGETFHIILQGNGEVSRVRVNYDGTETPIRTAQVSREELQQFQTLLAQRFFSEFNRVAYPAPSGAADFITVTLSSRNGTTRYTDIVVDQLPPDLKAVIEAWERIANRV